MPTAPRPAATNPVAPTLQATTTLSEQSASKPSGSDYFVDSMDGSDANTGASEAAPWKSLERVNRATLQPGDVVHFKRGSTWNGALTIHSSGVEGNPITFTAYGSGDAPVITYPGGDIDHKHRGILIYGHWVIVENLLVTDVFDDGIGLWDGASHNIIRNNEISNAGRGITVDGQNNLITQNFIHDLHMVLNDAAEPYDDYGATAVNFYGSNNEASYNRIENCKAPSFDYGTDGGAFEWWGAADGNYVHHNWAANNNGFAEVGGGSARNTLIAYNVSLNNGKFTSIHTRGDPMGSLIENFRVENNTVVELSNGEMQYSLIWFGGKPDPDTYFLRNNLFYVQDYHYLSDADGKGWSFVHEYNLYFFPNSAAKVGFVLNASEKMADPLFVNLAAQDFHLQEKSPARNAGKMLDHRFDFDNRPLTENQAPNIGAFEN